MYTDDMNVKLRALTGMYQDLANKLDGLGERVTHLEDNSPLRLARVVYDLLDPSRPAVHPQTDMGQLASQLGFRVIGSVPQSIGDCWWFWIEYSREPPLPSYVRKAEWSAVGCV